jgi:hypothetical protein
MLRHAFVLHNPTRNVSERASSGDESAPNGGRVFGRWRGGSPQVERVATARPMQEVRILVRVRGFKSSVVPVLTDFTNAIISRHGGVAMDDPTAFDRDGHTSRDG